MTQISDYTPKKIGNFNIPKSVIECKIDTLAILELMLRKNIASWEEIDEIREAVVLHLNVMFPELQLTYSTPPPMKDEAPFMPPEAPAKPLFYSAPPPEGSNIPAASEDTKPKTAPATNPLFQNVPPPKITSSVPRPGQPPIKPVTQQANAGEQKQEVKTEGTQNPTSTERVESQQKPTTNPNAPKPMFPNAGPPKILNNPPKKNI